MNWWNSAENLAWNLKTILCDTHEFPSNDFCDFCMFMFSVLIAFNSEIRLSVNMEFKQKSNIFQKIDG